MTIPAGWNVLLNAIFPRIGITISPEAQNEITGFMYQLDSVLFRLAQAYSALRPVDFPDIIDAATQILPSRILTIAVTRMRHAFRLYNTLPFAQLQRQLATVIPWSELGRPLMSDGAAIAMAVCLDFVASEILELAGNRALQFRRNEINKADITHALTDDDDLNILARRIVN